MKSKQSQPGDAGDSILRFWMDWHEKRKESNVSMPEIVRSVNLVGGRTVR